MYIYMYIDYFVLVKNQLQILETILIILFPMFQPGGLLRVHTGYQNVRNKYCF